MAKWGFPGFTMVQAPPHRRLVLSVWGGEKVGKTTFALSFPAPILFMNFDYSLDELLYARPELIGKIGKKDFPITEVMVARDLEPVLEDFQEYYGKAIDAIAGV